MSKSPIFSSAKLERELDGLLEPSAMYPFRLERDEVQADEVLNDRPIIDQLRQYAERSARLESEGTVPASVAALNAACVPQGYVPEALSHQDQIGRGVSEQTTLIMRAPFFKAIISHPDTVPLAGYEKVRQYWVQLADVARVAQCAGNLVRKHQIKTIINTRAEARLTAKCFGVLWPPGLNLYAILGELYPAFHAKMSAPIPLVVAEELSSLLDQGFESPLLGRLAKQLVNAKGRCLGLYPVAHFATEGVTEDAPFVAQDQLGRKAMARRVFHDAMDILRQYPEQVVIVVDYAGGVGNLAELFLRQVFALPQDAMKARLLDRVRVVVVDASREQLDAGKLRFAQMGRHAELAGIDAKVFFFHHDTSDPLGPDLSRIFRDTHDVQHPARPAYVGMTTYTLGAMSTRARPDGKTPIQAFADDTFRRCWKVYAADFSSPMWRRSDFLRDTGQWGHEYFRVVHGRPEPDDEKQRFKGPVASALSWKLSQPIHTVADYLRALSLAPGLASHLMSVWPHRDGHCSGYCVQTDGSLAKPGIVRYAERMASLGAEVDYKSKVFLFAALDLGSYGADRRLWTLMPGWIADFAVAKNDRNDPFRR